LIRAAGWFNGLAIKWVVPSDSESVSDADLADLAAFTEGLNGPFTDPSVSGWHLFDPDRNRELDHCDFAEFRAMFSPWPPKIAGDGVAVIPQSPPANGNWVQFDYSEDELAAAIAEWMMQFRLIVDFVRYNR